MGPTVHAWTTRWCILTIAICHVFELRLPHQFAACVHRLLSLSVRSFVCLAGAALAAAALERGRRGTTMRQLSVCDIITQHYCIRPPSLCCAAVPRWCGRARGTSSEHSAADAPPRSAALRDAQRTGKGPHAQRANQRNRPLTNIFCALEHGAAPVHHGVCQRSTRRPARRPRLRPQHALGRAQQT